MVRRSKTSAAKYLIFFASRLLIDQLAYCFGRMVNLVVYRY